MKNGDPNHLIPSNSWFDPPSALMAGESEEARVNIVQGTARCLLSLYWSKGFGLTDLEVIDVYRRNFPYSALTKGQDVFVRDVIRHWAICKPNDHPQNKLKRNLSLIHQTDRTRINPKSGKPMVVFQFIRAPFPSEVYRWKWAARSPRSLKLTEPVGAQRLTENEKQKISLIMGLPCDGSYTLLTPFEHELLVKISMRINVSPKQWVKLHELFGRIL